MFANTLYYSQAEEGVQAAAGGDWLRHPRQEAGRGEGALHGPALLGGAARAREAADIRTPPAGAHHQVQEELPGAVAREGGPLLPVPLEPRGHCDPGRHHGDHRHVGRGREVQGPRQTRYGQKTAAFPGKKKQICLCTRSQDPI